MITVKQTIEVFGSSKQPKCTIPLTENDIVMPQVYIRWMCIYNNSKKDGEFMKIDELISSLSSLLDDYYVVNAHLKAENYVLEYDPENLRSVLFSICESDVVLDEWKKENFPQETIPIEFAPNLDIEEEDPVLLAFTYTTLKCGSVVLGVAAHHWVTDGAGLSSFIENWDRRTQGIEIRTPLLDRSVIKPTADDLLDDHWEFLISEKIPQAFFELPPPSELTSQRFYFSPEKLKNLKKKVEKELEEVGASTWVSTNDCLMALVWRTVSRARGISGDDEIKFGFAINGRLRWPAPHIKDYFGNFSWYACARCTPRILLSSPLHVISLLFRDEVNRMDEKRIQSTINFVNRIKDKSTIYTSFVGKRHFSSTNWTSFPFYTDFKWGKPEKILISATNFDGMLISLPTAQEGGLEIVWDIEEKNFAKILNDPEFIEFAELS